MAVLTLPRVLDTLSQCGYSRSPKSLIYPPSKVQGGISKSTAERPERRKNTAKVKLYFMNKVAACQVQKCLTHCSTHIHSVCVQYLS